MCFTNGVFYLLYFLVNLANSNVNDNKLTKTKLLSCVGIARARVQYDKQYVDELALKLQRFIKQSDEEASHKKVLSLGLVNCFPVISSDQAYSLMSLINNHRRIDPFTKENRQLLNLENIENGIMPNKYSQKIEEINGLLLEIGDDYLLMKEEEKNKESKENNDIHIINFLNDSFDKLFLIFKLLGIDSYIGLFLIIALFFFTIRKARQLVTHKKRKKTQVNIENEKKED